MTANALDNQLLQGAVSGWLHALSQNWRMVEIEVDLPGMAGFTASPSLLNKLRGALGEIFLLSASEAVRMRQPCDRPYTSTAEIFFGRRPQIRLDGFDSEVAKPFVLWATGDRTGKLVLHMRIFGIGCERANAVADALPQAIPAIKWRELARDVTASFPPKVTISSIRVTERFLLLDKRPGDAKLLFLSPLDAERGNVAEHPELILRRLLRRLALVAPWHGISMATNFDSMASETIGGAAIELVDYSCVTSAERGGQHMANALTAPAMWQLKNATTELRLALQMGTLTHIGRGSSIGLGRYRMT